MKQTLGSKSPDRHHCVCIIPLPSIHGHGVAVEGSFKENVQQKSPQGQTFEYSISMQRSLAGRYFAVFFPQKQATNPLATSPVHACARPTASIVEEEARKNKALYATILLNRSGRYGLAC